MPQELVKQVLYLVWENESQKLMRQLQTLLFMVTPSPSLYHYQQGMSESKTWTQAAKQVFDQVSSGVKSTRKL